VHVAFEQIVHQQKFRGHDRMCPELWEKYGGYFVQYLARRIEALKAKMHVLA
jgi:hypothetical protein